MSLHEFQEVLLEVYNNHDSLEAFVTEPSTVLAGRDLTARERSALASIAPEDLRHFQGGLTSKRRGMVEKVLRTRAQMVVLAPSTGDGPSLFFLREGAIGQERVSEASFRLLEELARTRTPLSIASLRLVYRAHSTRLGVSNADLFRLTRIVARHGLRGREIFVL